MGKKSTVTSQYLEPGARRVDKVLVRNTAISTIDNREVGVRRGSKAVVVDPQHVYDMARLGLDAAVIGAYYGFNKGQFKELCEDYPDVESAYLMGFADGMKEAAQSLSGLVADKQIIPTIFRLKKGGWIEADKLIGKDGNQDNAPKVNIYLPDNGRDPVTIENNMQMVDVDES